MPIRIIVVLSAIILMAGSAWGQQQGKPRPLPTILSLEARGAFMLPHTEDVRGDVDVNQSLGFGAAVTYGYRDRAIEFSVEAFSVDLEDDELDGTVIMVPIFLSGYFRFHPFGRRWFPFIGAGVGVIINDYSPNEKKFKEEAISDAIAIQGILGFEFFLVRKWSFALQARYLYGRADFRTVDSNGIEKTDRFLLSTPVATFGIKKYF